MYSPEYDLAKERMAEAIKSREQDRLARQLRQAGRTSRKGMGIRTVGFVMALFRV